MPEFISCRSIFPEEIYFHFLFQVEVQTDDIDRMRERVHLTGDESRNMSSKLDNVDRLVHMFHVKYIMPGHQSIHFHSSSHVSHDNI